MVLKIFYWIFLVQILLVKTVLLMKAVPQPAGGTCDSGTFQSPIHLNRKAASAQQYTDIQWENVNKPVGHMKLINTGEGVEMHLPNKEDVTIKGGPVSEVHSLDHVEWRWDESEHRIGNDRAALETQLVFRNKRYASMDEAMGKRDGLVIVAVLHTLQGASSHYLMNLLQNFRQVVTNGAESSLDHPITIRSILPRDDQKYFTYRGSITKRPCYETVQWIVFTDYMAISTQDIRTLQTIRAADGEEIKQNFRKTQSINSRTVFYREFSYARTASEAMMPTPKAFWLYIAVSSCQLVVVFERAI